MLYADGFLGIAILALWVYALLEVLTADPTRIRNLPKWGWFVVVLVLGELGIGPLLWFVAGRPQGRARELPYRGNAALPAEYDRPGRAVASSPDDDAAFLATLRERADEQRRAAERERRAREADGT